MDGKLQLPMNRCTKIQFMPVDHPSYKWHKMKNGRYLLAGITLQAELSDAAGEHRIVEDYAGNGFTRQGYFESVPAKGYDSWKAAVREGLYYGLSKMEGYRTVTVEYLEGLTSDTTPAAIAYVATRALWDKAGFVPDPAEIQRLEDAVFSDRRQ